MREVTEEEDEERWRSKKKRRDEKRKVMQEAKTQAILMIIRMDVWQKLHWLYWSPLHCDFQ